MKLLRNTLPAAGLLGLIAGSALAQESGQPPRGKRQGGAEEQQMREMQQQADVEQFLSRFDRNEDEAIQKDELPARLREEFGRLDRNSDGELSREEIREHALRMSAACDQCQGPYLMVYQAVYDPLTLDDLQNAYGMLRTIDGNNDGKITEEEIKAAQEKVRQEHAQTIFKEWDQNNDNQISRDEANGLLRQRFEQIDRDNNKSISMQELQQAFLSQESPQGKSADGSARDSDR